MATITDEEKKSIAEDVKKQLIASAKSVQDFDKITELPESGSVTLPVVQPDGSTKVFDAGNWLKDREDAYKATQSATADAKTATSAANAAAESANDAATEANSAADAAKKRTEELNATDVSQIDTRLKTIEDKDIDGKYKKSNYNDGDEIIDFNSIHLIVDNPIYLFALVDADEKLLVGYRKDTATPVWGVGVPVQVKDYIDKQINKILGINDVTKTIDSLEEVEKFLQNFSNSDTLSALLSKKADKSYVDNLLTKTEDYYKKSNPNDGDNVVPSNEIYTIVNNSFFVKMLTDVVGNLLEGIEKDGTHKFFCGIDLQGCKQKVTENGKYIYMLLDKNDGLIFGILRKNAEFVFGGGIPTQFKNYITDFSKDVLKQAKDYTDSAIEKLPIKDDVVNRNQDKADVLYNACKFGDIDTRDSSYEVTKHKNKDFQLEIITDTHASPLSLQNAVKVANGFETIDALIHCGDIANWWYGSDYNYIKERMSDIAKCEKPWYIVIGNHDVGASLYSGASHIDAYNIYIKPMIEAGCLKEGEYQEGKCYYYHDFVSTDKLKYSNNIRLIVLYDYDNPLDYADNEYWEAVDYQSGYPTIQSKTYTYDANNPTIVNIGYYTGNSFRLKKSVTVSNDVTTYPEFKVRRNLRLFSKEQMDWFVSTLLSTPEGYGIVIATHMPFSTKISNQKELSFAISINRTGTDVGTRTDILADIANAYNKNVALNENVVFGGKLNSSDLNDASILNTSIDAEGNKYGFNVTADFANAKAKVYGFIGGHVHLDLIFKHDTYGLYGIYPICGTYEPPQLYGCDVARKATDGAAFDAITVTSWSNGRIALARVGNTKTIDGKNRDYEIITTN